MITWRQGFYRVSMRATGSTSTKGGPDDPADGLHPVLHVTLGAGHEQERLGVGRHLLPGSTCKTGRHRLTAGTPVQTWVPSPHHSLQPQHRQRVIPRAMGELLSTPICSSPTLALFFCNSSLCLSLENYQVSLFSLSLVIFLYQIRNHQNHPRALIRKRAYRSEASLRLSAPSKHSRILHLSWLTARHWILPKRQKTGKFRSCL